MDNAELEWGHLPGTRVCNVCGKVLLEGFADLSSDHEERAWCDECFEARKQAGEVRLSFSDEEIDEFYRSIGEARPNNEAWANEEDGYYDELIDGEWRPTGIVHTNWHHEWGGLFALGDFYPEEVTLGDIPKIMRRARAVEE